MASKYGLDICRGCGEPIRWIITTKLKRMPCDPAAIRFTPGGGPDTFVTKEGKVERGKRDKAGSAVGYISHFATCKQADRFRKRDQLDDYDQKRHTGLLEEGES